VDLNDLLLNYGLIVNVWNMTNGEVNDIHIICDYVCLRWLHMCLCVDHVSVAIPMCCIYMYIN
jgi:hypothetical protein